METKILKVLDDSEHLSNDSFLKNTYLRSTNRPLKFIEKMAHSNQTKLGRILKIILTLLIISMQFQIAISKPTSSLSEINLEETDPQKTQKNTEVLRVDSFNLIQNKAKNQRTYSLLHNERHKRSSNNPFSMLPIKINKEDKPKKDGNLLNNIKNDISSLFTSTKEKKTNKTGETKISHKNDTATNNVVAAQLNSTVKENTQSTTKSVNSTSENNLNISMNIKHEENFNKSFASSNSNTSPNNLNLNLNDTKTNMNSQLNVSSQQPTLKSGNTKLVSEVSNNNTTNPQLNEYAPDKNQNETFEKDKSLVNKTHLELPMTNKSQQHVDTIQSKNKTNNNNQTNFSTEHNGKEKSTPHLKLNESNVEGFINNGNYSEKSITNSNNQNQTFKLNNTSSEVNRSPNLKNLGEYQKNNNNSFKGNGSLNGISDIAHNLLKNASEEIKTISPQNKLDDGEKELIKTKTYTGAPMQNTSFIAPSAGHLETLDLNSSSHSPTNIGLRNNFNTSEETPLSTKPDIGSVGKNQSNTSLFQKSSTSGNQTRDTQIPPVKYPQNATSNSHDTPTSEGKLSSTPSASAISSEPNHSNGLLPTGTVSSLTKNSTSTSNGDAKSALNPQLNISSSLVLANPQIDHIDHPITPSEVAGKVPSTTGEFKGSNRTLSLTNSSPTKASSVGINNDISPVLLKNDKPKGIPSSPVPTNPQTNTSNPRITPHDKADGEVLPPRAAGSLKSVLGEPTPLNRTNSTSNKKLIPQPSSSPVTSKNMSKVELVEGSNLTAAPSHDLNDKTINFPSNNSHTNPQINTTNPLITPHNEADGEVLPPRAAGSSESIQGESTPVNRANSTSKKKLIPQPSSSPVTSKSMSKVELVEGSTLTVAPSHDLNNKTTNFPSKNFPVSSASNDTSTIKTPSGSMMGKYPNGVVNSTVRSNSLESQRNSSNTQGTTVNRKEGTVDVSTQGKKNNFPNHKSNETFGTTSNYTASRNNQSTSGMGNLNDTQRPIANKVIAQNTTHKSEKGNKNDVNGIPANIAGTESLSEGYTGTQNAPTPANILFLNQTNSLPKAENQLGNGFDPFKGLLGKNDGSYAGKGSSNKEGDLSNIPYTNDVSEEDDEIPYTNKVNSEDKIKGSDDDIVVMTESTVSSSGTVTTNKVDTTEKTREVFPVNGTSRKSSKITASPLPKNGKSTPTSAIIDETPFLINPKKTTTNPKVFDEKPFLINPEKNKAKPEVIDEHPFLINPKDRKPIKPTTTATTPLNNRISETTPDLQEKTVRTTSTEDIESTTPTPIIASTTNSTDADDKKDCENENTLGGILGSALHYGALGGAAGAVGAMLPQILNMIKDLFKKDGGDDGNKKEDDNKTGGEGNQSEKQDATEAQPEKTEDILEKELSDAEDKVMDEIDDKIDNIEGSVVDTIKGKLTEVEDGVFEDLKQQILNGEGTMLQNVQAVVGGENNVFKNVKGRLMDVKDSLVADVKTSLKSAIENDEDLSKLTKLIHKDSVKMTKVGENCVNDNYRTNVQMLFINEKARTRRTSWPPTRNDYLGKVGSLESVDEKLGKAEQETDSPVTKDSGGAPIEVNKSVVDNNSKDMPEVVTKTANVFGAFKKFMKN